MRWHNVAYRAGIQWTNLKKGMIRAVCGDKIYNRLVKEKLFKRVGNMKFREQEEAYVHHFVKEGSHCVDVGAFYGEFTYLLSKLSRSTGRVLAVEPIAYNFQTLNALIEYFKLSNVTARNVALGAKEQEALMQFPTKFGISQTAIARVVALSAPSDSTNSHAVHMFTLDRLIEDLGWRRVDFIKCDVEGAELMVLRGGERSIIRHSPVILMEVAERWTQEFGHHMNDVFAAFDSLKYSSFFLMNERLIPYDASRRVNDNSRIIAGRSVNNFFLIAHSKLLAYSPLIAKHPLVGLEPPEHAS